MITAADLTLKTKLKKKESVGVNAYFVKDYRNDVYLLEYYYHDGYSTRNNCLIRTLAEINENFIIEQ